MAQNPLVQVNLTIGTPVNGVVPVTIGANTYYVNESELLAIWNDRDETSLRKYVLCQMALVLQQAGVNPTTATFAQIQTAIQTPKYWV
jgi:hypothetical protein